jgi:ketosteroid isomerase-like protein
MESRYADMKAAMAAHDSAAIAAILAPDFASVDVSGQSKGASERIAAVTALKPDPNRSSETTLISVTPAADTVTVEQRYHMTTVATAADGTRHSVELVTLSTDSWVKPVDVWLIRRTVTNELSLFRDGQVVMHKKRP